MKVVISIRHQNRGFEIHPLSHDSPVLSGVLQVTVLGPLIFIILMGDINHGMFSSSIVSFADDARLYHGISSVDDYLIIDTDLHQRFEKMTIDEQKEEFDLSHHNMLTAIFTVKKDLTHPKKTYVKINEEPSRRFTAQVNIKINHNTTLEQYEYIIKEVKQQCMVRTINKRFLIITGEEEKAWFCEKIKREISLRKKYNRKIRNETDRCKREMLGGKYREQKKKTHKKK